MIATIPRKHQLYDYALRFRIYFFLWEVAIKYRYPQIDTHDMMTVHCMHGGKKRRLFLEMFWTKIHHEVCKNCMHVHRQKMRMMFVHITSISHHLIVIKLCCCWWWWLIFLHNLFYVLWTSTLCLILIPFLFNDIFRCLVGKLVGKHKMMITGAALMLRKQKPRIPFSFLLRMQFISLLCPHEW